MNLHGQFRKPLDDGLKFYHVWSIQVGILWFPSMTEGQYRNSMDCYSIVTVRQYACAIRLTIFNLVA